MPELPVGIDVAATRGPRTNFDSSCASEPAMTIASLTTPPPIEVSKQASALRRWNEPLGSPLEQDFAAAFEPFGEARIVLLGEASHGTSEFYSARAAVTRMLIEHHGFNVVA